MTRSRSFYFSCFMIFAILAAANPIIATESTQFNPNLFKYVDWRQIGPAYIGGRIDDIEAVVSNPNLIFVGSASGGIFKSVNNGTTWKAVFDEEGTSLSIGDIAIAPSDPNIVWAGTGEPNGRQSSSWGDGVYKSVDGGETWEHMGLKETHNIGRIVIHPRDPEIVFVAALGHLWGPNPERGLYRTKDGGKTWEKTLSIDDDTGVVDVAMEENGRVLYAAAYQRRRRAWGFVGGGPHSGLYRSLDGGDTWEKLTKGLPEGDTGRIGIDISKSHPHIVYAIIENKNGGVFRSEDRGESWEKKSSLNPRPMYYSQIRVDPKNPNKVWVLGALLFVSIDGGKNFITGITNVKMHVDHHALWINPSNPDHLLVGNDGGFYTSYDGSKNWDFIGNIPIAQYYAIGIDTREPYWIYGGTQDNGSWGIPSRTFSQLGIQNSDVVQVGYGDGFYAAVDPRDYTVIYSESQNGRLYLADLTTREEKGICPVPEDPKEEYRWNWCCPLIISPLDPNIVYYGANRLFKTTDKGYTWVEISLDLTKNQDWKKLPIMGVARDENTLSRDDGVSYYGTITTIAESPVQAGLIYIGTDDGNVQMTKDGGKTWQDLTKKFPLPGPRWVTRVLCSHHAAGTAYTAFSGHQDNDFTPYIFESTDFGQTWKSIRADMPNGMVINVIAEHPRNPNFLLVGTEFGLFVSINGGKNWILPGGNLPRVPIDDIIINARENDIILGTHGRGIIILDDVTFLEKLDQKILDSDVYLFPSRGATQYYEKGSLPQPGASEFSGPNPDYGALITYYLQSDPAKEEKPQKKENPETSEVKIIILDKDGMVVRELKGPDRKGFSRISWDLRYPLFFDTGYVEGSWYGPFWGPFALPGEYTVKLIARGQELVQTVQIRVDPQAKTTVDHLKARFEANMTVNDLHRAFKEGQKAVSEMDKELNRTKETLKEKKDVPDEISNRIRELSKKFDEIKKEFIGNQTPNFAIIEMAGQLQASFTKPTQAQMRSIDHLMDRVGKNVEILNAFLTKEYPDLQNRLIDKGIRAVPAEPIKPPKRK